MKKNYILLVLIAISFFQIKAAVDWSSKTNIAHNCEVIVSSKAGEANLITDGNTGTRWQAIAKTGERDWVLVNLGNSFNLGDLEIKWEASYSTKYNIYITSETPTYSANESGYNVISSEWLANNTPQFTHSDEDGLLPNFLDSRTNIDVNGQYILVYSIENGTNAENYGNSIFEIMAGERKSDYDILTHIAINDLSVINGTSGTVDVLAMTGGNYPL